MITRRTVLGSALAVTLSLVAGLSQAQQVSEFPKGPIRIILGLAPGASTDTGTRMLAHALSEASSKNFIVENRVGAGSTIAAAAVAQATPDGHTLFMGTGSYATSAVLHKSLTFDPVEAFVPVTQINRFPQAIGVPASSDIHTLQDLIKKAKEDPGAVMYGSTGHGGQTHLTGELFQMLTGAEMTHVPYKGANPAILELLGGRIPVVFVDLFSLLPHARKGDIRVIAVTSPERAQIAPEIPTAAEQGVEGLNVNAWLGLFAPAGTPPEAVAWVQQQVAMVAAQPEFRENMAQSGAELVVSTPEEFNSFFREEVDMYRDVAKKANIQMD